MRRGTIAAFILLTMLSVAARATVITHSVECIAGPARSAGPGDSCSQFWYTPLTGQAGSDAHTSVTEEFRLPFAMYTATVLAEANAASYNWDPDHWGERAFASASTSMLTTLATFGPVRTGWIDLQLLYDGDYGGNIWFNRSMFASVGPYVGTYPGLIGRFPMTLGVPFVVDMRASALADTGDFLTFEGRGGGAYGYASVSFSLYEADGVTSAYPFAADVPEPADLAALGLMLIVVARLLRRGHGPQARPT